MPPCRIASPPPRPAQASWTPEITPLYLTMHAHKKLPPNELLNCHRCMLVGEVHRLHLFVHHQMTPLPFSALRYNNETTPPTTTIFHQHQIATIGDLSISKQYRSAANPLGFHKLLQPSFKNQSLHCLRQPCHAHLSQMYCMRVTPALFLNPEQPKAQMFLFPRKNDSNIPL